MSPICWLLDRILKYGCPCRLSRFERFVDEYLADADQQEKAMSYRIPTERL